MDEDAVYQPVDLGRLYRFDSHRCSAGVDEWDNPLPGCVLTVRLYTYPIVKRTPKGVWINVYGDRRFIRLGTKKSFALPTEEEAKASFIARKKAHIRILTEQLRRAEVELELIDKENKSQYIF
jgi:hypothetical protein